ncbi:hypothetical protein K439DRAFT_1612894 [Ramaria rubella]|nr:hypothetical protein K439DRAFT_1612894 [Ramaria rubella]
MILTRSQGRSPPAAANSGLLAASSTTTATLDTQWPTPDLTAFMDFLVDHKAEAGNSMIFKGPLWTCAAAYMTNHASSGGIKTAGACRLKWGCMRGQTFVPSDYVLTWLQLKGDFQRVTALKGLSGLP